MKISNQLPSIKRLLIQRLSWFGLLVGLNLAPTALAATDCTNAAIVIPQAQCQILLDLYNSTNGPAWSDSATNNWNVTNTPCSWTGVTCSGGVIQRIDRGSQNLFGTLPASLSTLTSLTYLDLRNNRLSGNLSNLPVSLTYLNLFNNRLSGSLPGWPASLIYLNLGYNRLSGNLPSWPASLSELYLFNNNLSGNLPSWPASLTNLNLSYNSFGGSLPSLPANLTSLILNNNSISGSLPSLPTSLSSLFLQNNQLTGIIPDLTVVTDLVSPNVDLSCNQFIGETGSSATAKDPDWATNPLCPPKAPIGLTATPVSTTQIDLSWTANSTDETWFKIESPAGTLIKTTAANATRYSHTGLTCGTTYTYSLKAPNAGGESAAITARATTASCSPTPITATDLTPYQDTGLAVRVTVDGSGQGRVVSTQGIGGKSIDCSSADQATGCQANFAPATYVTLTPRPAVNSAFSGWGGNVDCNKESLFITGGVLCIAYFRTLIHPLTVEIQGRGKITGKNLICTATTCTGNYREDTKVTLQARPTPSWTFAGWSGDCEEFNRGITPLQGVLSLTTAKNCGVTFLDDPNIPNQGDGNGDGLKDAEQDNVVSLPDKVTGNYLTLEVDKGCTLDEMSTDTMEKVTGYDKKYQFPQGLLYFDIACAKTKVTLYLHGIPKIIRRYVLQKYGPTIPGDMSTLGWYPIPNVTFDTVKVGTQTVMRASYNLVDGELGDNTGVDGHIIDPAAVAVAKGLAGARP